MDFDRRTLLLAAMVGMTSGCARAAAPQGKSDPGGWARFKAAFLQQDGRIVDTGNGGISHSEGQGYGMLLAEAAGDRDAFKLIHGWTERILARSDVALFSWRYAPHEPIAVADPNNASDGDTLIAWALMRAGRRWRDKSSQKRAQEIRDAIRANLVRHNAGRTVLLPGKVGFEAGDRITLNLSYYIWPALDAFAAADGVDSWQALIRDGEMLIAQSQFGPLGLPTDWIDIVGKTTPEPARGRPPRFGYDAVRIPLYLAMGGRARAAGRIAAFWKSYAGRGVAIPAWVDVVTGEVAPYGLSAGGMAVVRRLIGPGAPGKPDPAPDYYSAVLEALTHL